MDLKQRESFVYVTIYAFRIHLGLQNCNCVVPSRSDLCVKDFHQASRTDVNESLLLWGCL